MICEVCWEIDCECDDSVLAYKAKMEKKLDIALKVLTDIATIPHSENAAKMAAMQALREINQ